MVGVIGGRVGFDGSDGKLGAPGDKDEGLPEEGIGVGERFKFDGLIGGDWVCGGGDDGGAYFFVGSDDTCEDTLVAFNGGDSGIPGLVAPAISMFMLDSSLAWLSPKL